MPLAHPRVWVVNQFSHETALNNFIIRNWLQNKWAEKDPADSEMFSWSFRDKIRIFFPLFGLMIVIGLDLVSYTNPVYGHFKWHSNWNNIWIAI